MVFLNQILDLIIITVIKSNFKFSIITM